MVCLAVQTFGATRPVCYSRPLVHHAYIAIESGNLFESGCLLREALRLFLVAGCEAYGCKPDNEKRLTIEDMSKALLKTDGMDDGGFVWVMGVVDLTDRLARCQRVRKALIDVALGFLTLHINHSPEIDSPEWRRGGAA